MAALETLRQMAVDDKSMYLDQTDEKYGRAVQHRPRRHDALRPVVALDIKEPRSSTAWSTCPGSTATTRPSPGPDLWVLFDHEDANRAGASRDFIKWLTSAEIDAKWNLAVGNLPLRSSEKDTPEFAAYVKEYPGGQKFFDNLANAKQARPTVSRLRGDVPQRRRGDRQGAAGRRGDQGGPRRGGPQVEDRTGRQVAVRRAAHRSGPEVVDVVANETARAPAAANDQGEGHRRRVTHTGGEQPAAGPAAAAMAAVPLVDRRTSRRCPAQARSYRGGLCSCGQSVVRRSEQFPQEMWC